MFRLNIVFPRDATKAAGLSVEILSGFGSPGTHHSILRPVIGAVQRLGSWFKYPDECLITNRCSQLLIQFRNVCRTDFTAPTDDAGTRRQPVSRVICVCLRGDIGS